MKQPFLGDGKIITGANVLCVVRLVLAVLTAQLLAEHRITAAFWCALAGILTDLVDGFVAKRGWLGGVSNLGKIIDPVADKAIILVPTAALLFTLHRDGHGEALTFRLLAAATGIIVFRELAIFVIKRNMAKRYGVESAIESARASMALQSGGFLLLILTGLSNEPVATFAIGIMVSASLVAGWDYFATARRRVRELRLAA